MSAAEQHDPATPTSDELTPLSLAAVPDIIEVRRSGGVAALIGAASSALAIAWFGRAVASGSLFDWILVAVTAALGVVWLSTFLDARTPLLVADGQGARIRLGRSWIGLPWSAVESVRHSERTSWLRDGRIEVVAHNPERLLAGLTPQAARQAALAQRLHGGPLALPLGLGTTLVGSDHQRLGTDIAALAFVDPDVVLRPVTEDVDEPTLDVTTEHTSLAQRLAPLTGRLAVAKQKWVEQAEARAEQKAQRAQEQAQAAELLAQQVAEQQAATARESDMAPENASDDAAWADTAPAHAASDGAGTTAALTNAGAEPGATPADQGAAAVDVVASPTPQPLREVPRASRSEVLRVVKTGGPADAIDGESSELDPALGREQLRDSGVSPIATQGHTVAPVVIDDYEVEPANDPVIGPDLRAARTRLGLSVDKLAERTRIRPHVIEAIEVDDFVPCGGDFYARGHLRTLARVLGVPLEPLLERYDERYAHAPVEARKVFEAELATGSHGSIRGTRGGPNWSVLVAAVMAVVLAWSIVQLVMDQPGSSDDTPVLNGSGGPQGGVVVGEPVEVKIAAPRGGAEIVVRDANGEIVFSGSLAVGEKTTVEALAPVRVQSSDGAVTVTVGGRDRGPVGTEGEPAQGTYAGK